MVGSFRNTTQTWLEQRLAADIYIRPAVNMAPRMTQWLENQDEVKQVWWQWRKMLQTEAGTLQVVSIGGTADEKKALAVKVAIPDYWQKLHHDRAILVSESMALKQNLKPGQVIDLPPPLNKQWLVAGVFYDYGNPYADHHVSETLESSLAL